jgi:hypothetical protein
MTTDFYVQNQLPEHSGLISHPKGHVHTLGFKSRRRNHDKRAEIVGSREALDPTYESSTARSRSALAITLTDDSAMASAAIIGESSTPVKG